MSNGKSLMTSIALRAWPPKGLGLVALHRDAADEVLQISGHPEGFMSISLATGNEGRRWNYRRIVFDGSLGFLTVAAVVGDSDPVLYINGIPVPLCAEPGKQRAKIIKTAGVPTPTDTQAALITPVVPSFATPEEALFIRKMQDLQARLDSDDSYTVLQASGLLRHILLDSLWHKANVRVRAPATFRTVDFRLEFADPAPAIDWLTLSPPNSELEGALSLTLDEFLAAPVLRNGSLKATTRDLIGTCANVKGGVHLGKPKGGRAANELALLQVDDAFRAFGQEPTINALRSVCRITVRALCPTVLAIQAGAFAIS